MEPNCSERDERRTGNRLELRTNERSYERRNTHELSFVARISKTSHDRRFKTIYVQISVNHQG